LRSIVFGKPRAPAIAREAAPRDGRFVAPPACEQRRKIQASADFADGLD
jgi:hypothetical protein